MRIWKSSDHRTIDAGQTGPMSSYDVPEQIEADHAAGLHISSLQNNDIEQMTMTTTANIERSPNILHHVRTIRNVPEAYIAGYSQGARVLGFKNFSDANPVVEEKAYFDFSPTLNYDKNSDYFFLNGRIDGGYYDKFTTYANYYCGVWDLYPDIKRDDGTTKDDEKFLYGMAIGEGHTSMDNFQTPDIDRNWLPRGVVS